MKPKSELKWACIQPLTGGMYFGTEQSIGHKAEFILSYKGLDDVKKDKDGNIVIAGNEYNLKEYLKQHDSMPPYYVFDKPMFSEDICGMCPHIMDEDGNDAVPNYEGLDLVVAVPVCSGLSMVTAGKEESKSCRNNNMLFLAKYALNVIKPKIYIFENAPTLMGPRGDELRKDFEKFGKDYGYNVLYYRTDTMMHHNCQKRVRTFVSFIKKDVEYPGTPVYGFENSPMSIKEFFASIPKGLTQQEECVSQKHNYISIDFLKSKYGENWTEHLTKPVIMHHIIENNQLDEFLEYAEKYDDVTEKELEYIRKYISHIKYKTSLGLNYYGNDCVVYTKHLPAISFRSIRTTLHPSNKRICTVREYLELMGMPHDFTLYGNDTNWPKIGQNVPVKTAKFIADQAVSILTDWENAERRNCEVLYINNINKNIEEVA